MNLDKIQEMWERDAVIDPDNLHDESLKIPQLHAKYYTVYNTVTLLREKAREQYNKIRLERHNYYTGKAPAEVYVEEPFGYKVREKDAIQRIVYMFVEQPSFCDAHFKFNNPFISLTRMMIHEFIRKY